MMHTESHIFSALSMMCVLKITVLPRRLSSSTASLSACALIGSRPLNGSSRMTSSGSCSSVRDELHLLLHAARQLVDLRVAPVLVAAGETESRQPLVDARVGDARLESLELGEEQQHAAHLHLLVEAALFGQIADAVERRRRSCSAAPNSEIVPESGTMMSRIMRMVVVLPAPLGPSSP